VDISPLSILFIALIIGSLFQSEIYHLACPASPVHYQFNAVKTIKTSFQGTLNMLGLAKRTKARFLLTSTSGKQ
jgi:nucleoside-diphosphate-sugar epimerase